MSTNDNMALLYLAASASLNEALLKNGEGDPAQAELVELEAKKIGAQLLLRSPQYAAAVTRSVGSFAINGGVVMVYSGFPGAALERFRTSTADLQSTLRKDPSMGGAVDTLSIHQGFEGRAMLALGRPGEALLKLRAALAPYATVTPNAFHSGNLSNYAYDLAELEHDLGLAKEAEKTRSKWAKLSQLVVSRKEQAADRSRFAELRRLGFDMNAVLLNLPHSNPDDADKQIPSLRARIKIAEAVPVQLAQQNQSILFARSLRLWLLQIESIVAEKKNDNERVVSICDGLIKDATKPSEWFYRIQAQIRFANALFNLGRAKEAKAVAASAITALNEKISKGSDSQIVRKELARALLVGSKVEDAAGGTQLKQAAALIEQMPVEMRSLHSINVLSTEIVAAMKKRGMSPSSTLTSAARPLQS